MSVEKLQESKEELEEAVSSIGRIVEQFDLPESYAELAELMRVQIRAIDKLLAGEALSFPLEGKHMAYQQEYSEDETVQLISTPRLKNLQAISKRIITENISDDEKEQKLKIIGAALHSIDTEPLEYGAMAIAKHIRTIESSRGTSQSDDRGYYR